MTFSQNSEIGFLALKNLTETFATQTNFTVTNLQNAQFLFYNRAHKGNVYFK